MGTLGPGTLGTLGIMEGRGFATHAFPTKEAMRDFVLGSVAPGRSVGFGGSVTAEELGLYEALVAKGCPAYFHWKADRARRPFLFEKARSADFYICSANGVSEDGALLQIDGTGNRVGAVLHGPETVFFVLGENKFSGTREETLERAKSVACPLNARRLGLRTPCALTGRCTDCRSPQRMCRYTLWTEGPRKGAVIHVCVAPGTLGF